MDYCNLSILGFQERYVMYYDGKVYDTEKNRYLKLSKNHEYSLIDKEGKTKKRSIKVLYRLCFNKEYCIDNIEDKPGELWLTLQEDDCYLVSNKGRIKSYKRYEAIILTPWTNDKGYQYVTISDSKLEVSRLVCKYFDSENYSESKEVHHINGNKSDNSIENLKCLTEQEHIEEHKRKATNE